MYIELIQHQNEGFFQSMMVYFTAKRKSPAVSSFALSSMMASKVLNTFVDEIMSMEAKFIERAF